MKGMNKYLKTVDLLYSALIDRLGKDPSLNSKAGD
jgi:hypothetical protein